jgi:outer membrane protein OmpA-like peptidoglycan-associated protein
MESVQGRAVAMRKGEARRVVGILAGALGGLMVIAGIVVWTDAQREERAVAAAVATAGPAPVGPPTTAHADVYFDFKSTRLTADGAAVLQEQARLVAGGGTWAVLVHGYADQQGPAAYNLGLAERRAEGVKRFLVELGVPEPAVKVVTVGQDGAVCDDPGPECQRLNRRVHVEMRRLALPARPAADAIVER